MPSSRALLLPAGVFAAIALVAGAGLADPAQPDDQTTRSDLAAAQAALRGAQTRSRQLAEAAQNAGQAADRTARDAAAVAGQIQQAEAQIALDQVRLSLLDQQRFALRAQLAAQQQPLVQLSAALERVARRPLLFSLARGDQLRDTIHVRAVFATLMPDIATRSASVRQALAKGRALRSAVVTQTAHLRTSETQLAQRREQLASLESGQRLDARRAAGRASRESDHALALAEQTRDLSALVARLGSEGALRGTLAALPGPLARPGTASAGRTADLTPTATGTTRWILPVTGRIVSGFGEAGPGGPAHGLTIAPIANAQIIAPAGGRVAFAGRYRGYGQIVILEHPGGWTSLVAGLGAVSVAVGDTLVQGAPLGQAPPIAPRMLVELRKDGVPVNPLAQP